MKIITKLDYSLQSPEERKALVEKIIAETPDITPAYLEILADYLVTCMEKQEKKEKKILTENRLTTVNKRETSFEGLVSQLENGEDGIYNLISENKNALFTPKISITKQDLADIPSLQQLRDTINCWDAALKRASGKDAFVIKKALIEMRKEQYVIKQAYRKPIIFSHLAHGAVPKPEMDDNSYLTDEDEVVVAGVSLMDPKVCSAILCNYSKLKEDSYDNFDGDLWYLLESFDAICGAALADFPVYDRLVELKIDGASNADIQLTLEEEFGIKHSYEYISSLWRNKIPKVIAQTATEEFVEWYWTVNKRTRKKCSCCGQFKPAHTTFFSKNNTSTDGFYSVCKVCRKKKRRGE